MRVPSRYMPTYEETLTWKSHSIGYALLFVFIGWFLYVIWDEPYLALFFFGVILISSVSGSSLSTTIEKRMQERSYEDIGTFTRSLDYRNIDTWIIRAVYEEIGSELDIDGKIFPLRGSDNLYKDLRLDDEDLYYVFNRVMARTGISDLGAEENPYYHKVETVEDMILFLNAQPKGML